MEFEVKSILEKGYGPKGEEKFLVKWTGSKRSSWVYKTQMNCDQLLLIFERENGPKILGAKREFDGGVVYMVKPNDGNKEQFIPSNETKKFLVPVIDFLQSKIVFEKRDTDNYSQAKLIHSCDEPHSVICKWLLAKFNLEYASERNDGLHYFFQHSGQNISMLSAEDALIKHPELVLKFLEKCFA